MENKLNARELRVGNYLMDTMEDAGIIQVLEIKETSDRQRGNMAISYIGVKGGYCTTSLEEDADHDEERFIQSIPLTEDELVKLGASETEEGLHKFSQVGCDMDIVVAINDTIGTVVLWQDDPVYIYNVNTVHHLQNIIHALTGKELTYNN